MNQENQQSTNLNLEEPNSSESEVKPLERNHRENFIDFTDSETTNINNLAKGNKFDMKNSRDLVYPNNSFDELIIFNKSVRFLEFLRDNITDAEVGKKIKNYIGEKINIIRQGRLFENELSSPTAYGRGVLLFAIEKFLIENKDMIHGLTNFVSECGKLKKEYDPSDTSGYY